MSKGTYSCHTQSKGGRVAGLEAPQDRGLVWDGKPPRRYRIWPPWRSRQFREPWRSRYFRGHVGAASSGSHGGAGISGGHVGAASSGSHVGMGSSGNHGGADISGSHGGMGRSGAMAGRPPWPWPQHLAQHLWPETYSNHKLVKDNQIVKFVSKPSPIN